MTSAVVLKLKPYMTIVQQYNRQEASHLQEKRGVIVPVKTVKGSAAPACSNKRWKKTIKVPRKRNKKNRKNKNIPQPQFNNSNPPSRPSTSIEVPWFKVLKRKEKNKENRDLVGRKSRKEIEPISTKQTFSSARPTTTTRRVPNTSAVVINCPRKRTGKILTRAKISIKLENFGIEVMPSTDHIRIVWIRCPVVVANKAAITGYLKIEWARTKVKLVTQEHCSAENAYKRAILSRDAPVVNHTEKDTATDEAAKITRWQTVKPSPLRVLSVNGLEMLRTIELEMNNALPK
ncbi:hypothetical protein PUN28_006140 [Cardiocondyla obscurior]|uniref:Uncharacterized protein n=1 Tax=Cardiocondyla obscurior TaxID=286306 RepID=A0AAW2G7X4_9HYME